MVSSESYSVGLDGEEVRHESRTHEITTQIIEITEIEEEEFEVRASQSFSAAFAAPRWEP